MNGRHILWAGMLTSLLPVQALAEEKVPDFLRVSLADAVDMEVTSVSRKSEKASEAAAAIYVITSDDIRRSGAANLVEALRLAPGIQVARSGSSQWAVSARGFNDQFANKLLVLIDGRTIYNPTFSGVWWDLHNPIAEDIERIEIIRGPGATAWGSNAVNGVINIITRHSEDTQGTLLHVGAGTDTKLNTQIRQGFELGEDAHMRVYATREEHNELKRAGGQIGNQDAWDISHGGFRGDWSHKNGNNFTLQGDLYQGSEDQHYNLPLFTAPYSRAYNDKHEVKGVNLLGRWDKQINDHSKTTLQSYIDYNSRDIVVIDNQEFTYDLDFQHNYDFNARDSLTWGIGYRFITDRVDGTDILDFNPDIRNRSLYTGFFENKYALLPETVFLTVGSKFEHNDFTGFEYQPSARLSWLMDSHQMVWASVSRALRTPDRNDDIINPISSFSSPFGTTVITRRGSDDSSSERLMAYEAGYRIQPSDDWAIDISAFYNDYDNLIINSLGSPRPVTNGGFSYIELPLQLINAGKGRSYGGSAVVDWQATRRWKLEAQYSYLDIDLQDGSSTVNTEFKSPQHQAGLNSRIDLADNWEFDQNLSYTGSIRTQANTKIEDYMRLDLRLGWKPMDNMELSLTGANLLDGQHPEFGPFLYNDQAEVGRSVYGQMVVRF